MTDLLGQGRLIACIIVALSGFTFAQMCIILTMLLLTNKERKDWRQERMELQSRVQAGTPEMFLRMKMTTEQLKEGVKQADHERELEKKAGPKDEPGDSL